MAPRMEITEVSIPTPSLASDRLVYGRFRRVFEDVVAELRVQIWPLGFLDRTRLGMEIDASSEDEHKTRDGNFFHIIPLSWPIYRRGRS